MVAARLTLAPEERRPSPSSRRGATGAALDVLLTDAAIGNPVARVLRFPAPAVGAATKIVARPDRVARRALSLGRDVVAVTAGRSDIAPPKGDRRFADPAWSGNPLFRRLMQTYFAVGAAAYGVVDDADLDWRADTTARFIVGNAHDFVAPTNMPLLNPSVIKETLDQGGGNLVKGFRRAVRDVRARRLPAMVDTSKFDVGENLALTTGSVVLRTETFELLHYAPLAKRVHEVPLLFVPPTINKFYVLDLAPDRSLVQFMLEQGFQVFMISWRNPEQMHGHFDFDTYASAVLEARAAVAEICGSEQVNINAACSGGLITTGALAHLVSELDEPGSLALMVAALDSSRAGTTSALANRELAAAAVAESARKGYLESSALANVFAWLRPNDLVWGYVVNNYLMGKAPPAFDILYWNQDGVRLSAGLHRDFVHMALDNRLVGQSEMEVLGTPVDLRELDIDVYMLAGLNDHIVPWENVFRGAQIVGGNVRFVLSTSGHIQALINPPGPGSRSSFRATDDLPGTPAELVEQVPTTSGSWWPDYTAWLAERSGALKPARKTLGSASFKPTAKAPGTYVHAN